MKQDRKISPLTSGAALLLLLSFTACGGNDGGGGTSVIVPTVVASTPLNGALDAPLNGSVSATFSEPMDAATLTDLTFTLAAGAVKVPGTVIYTNSKAEFRPSTLLVKNTPYTATLTTGVKSAKGVALAANYTWSFTTGTTIGPELSVNLGTAGNFVILAKSAISTVPTSAVTGDLGISPAAASFITGFALIADATNVFSTSTQVTGKVYAADYAPPTPSNLTTAVSDMQFAFTDAAGRAPSITELGSGNIGGMTLAPGVYKWGTGVLIPTNVTLAGSATDVWIFQIAQGLTVASAAKTILTGGAVPQNVFWQVSGAVDLGTTSHLEGVVLSKTAIALKAGASVNGRLMAQTAVNINSSTVVKP